MKIAALTVAAALIAGAASAQTAPAVDPSAATFTGWVKVTNGEYQLFPEQRDLTQPFVRPCTAVVLPRDLQRASGDIAGAQVTFTGRAVPWAERDTPTIMRFQGSRVANECRGDYVIQAQSFRIVRGA